MRLRRLALSLFSRSITYCIYGCLIANLSCGTQAPTEEEPLFEEIVFDEIDFHHTQAFMGNVYPSVVPARVREVNAEYFFRSDRDEARSGSRFGEMVVSYESGAILYFPRALDLAGVRGVRFSYRKSNPASLVSLGIYPDIETRRSVTEGGHAAWPSASTPGWHHVTVPIEAFTAWVAQEQTGRWRRWLGLRPKPAPAAPWSPRFPFTPVAQSYQVPEGQVFGVDIALTGANAGDKLLFDRLVFLRSGPPERTVRGRVIPPAERVTVRVATPTHVRVTQTDEEGAFSVALDQDEQKIDVLAHAAHRWFAPTAGRYLEVGDVLRSLEIYLQTTPSVPAPGAHNVRHRYTADKGSTYLPGSYFAFGLGEEEREFYLELRSNKDGFLDRDRRTENPDGMFRVAVNGECIFESQHVSASEAYWNAAEAKLSFLGGRPVEVINTAHNDSVLISGWPLLKNHITKFQPDIFLVTFATPAVMTYMVPAGQSAADMAAQGHSNQYLFDLNDTTGELIHIPHDPNWVVHRPLLTEEEQQELMKPYDYRSWWCGDPDAKPEWFQRLRKVMVLGLRMMRDETEQHGGRLIFGYFSPWGTVEMRQMSYEGQPCQRERVRDEMRSMVEEAGITFVDLTKYLRKYHIYDEAQDTPIINWKHAGHWTPAGHFFAGESLAEYLYEEVNGVSLPEEAVLEIARAYEVAEEQ